ncbi:cytochrome P450 [Chytriomyces sp. MP71]|nr:cytochrome P450 [Chytriomyces sp. MP71]
MLVTLILKAFAAVTILAATTSLGMILAANRRTAILKRANPNLTVHAVLIPPYSILTLLGLIPSWIKLKFPRDWMWHRKFSQFESCTDSIFAICTYNSTSVHVAHPHLAHEIMVNRYKEFLKPVHHYHIVDIYGKNIVSTEGDEWRRHRKVAAPTFSEQNNAYVYESSVQTAQRMFTAWEQTSVSGTNGVKEHRVNVSNDMMEFALSVISSAGFGIDVSWHTEEDKSEFRIKKGNTLSFKQALETVVNRLPYYIITPRPLFYLPIKYLQDTKRGFVEFESYLDQIIDDAESETSTEKPKNVIFLPVKHGDILILSSIPKLLQMLAQSTFSQKSEESKMTKSELKGNSFVFILAGHETTAGVLTYALTMLAIHPEKQSKLFHDIKQQLGNTTIPEYKDIPKLRYALAVMNETMRLFPPVTSIPKFTAAQTLSLGQFVFPAQTMVNIAIAALHYNPVAWGEDTFAFKPERFMVAEGETPGAQFSRPGFAPFSEGPRGCLGKKFAQVEFLTLLALLSLNYTWRLPEGAKIEDMLDSGQVVTLKPKQSIELLFSRR